MEQIICVSGGIASGKTTFARALVAGIPNSQMRSFGDVVRQVASEQGVDRSRESLQGIGSQLIASGWPGFVDKLLAGVPEDTSSLIVDGLRHRGALHELQTRKVASRVLTFFIDTPSDVVESRINDRGESLNAPKHAVEAELPEVAEMADLVLNGSLDLRHNVSVAMAYLQR